MKYKSIKQSGHAFGGVTPRYGWAARLCRAFEEAPSREQICQPKRRLLEEVGTVDFLDLNRRLSLEAGPVGLADLRKGFCTEAG
jgi:hypothetical protein